MELILLIALIIIIVLYFVYGISHDIGRSCSDCANYKVCYNNSMDQNHLDAPACDKFK